MEPQSLRANLNDCGIVPEDPHDRRREQKSDHCQRTEYDCPRFKREEKALAKSGKFARTVIISRDRLEALSQADHRRADEHGNPANNGHSGDGGISIRHRAMIQRDRGETVEHLPDQTRKPDPHDQECVSRII